MKNILLSPPVVFIMILFTAVVVFKLCSRLSFRKKSPSPDSKKAYACGEDFKEHLIQPDYSQFFPFAFFFTILHVVALVITTVPTETMDTFVMAAVYVAGAIIGLVVLLRSKM